jgi:hypothetical protein
MLFLSREKTMLTEKQLVANRANAQLSSGPKSEVGKRRSSLNARRHNLTGQVTAMTGEDRIAHSAFSEALIKSIAPEGALELQLAQRIATDSWRLNRSSAIEDNIFALGFTDHSGDIDVDHPELHAALTAARTFTREAKSIELLTLYEQRINRSLQKNLALLQQLQTTRKAERQAEMEQAAKLLQLNKTKGLPYDPTKDGFVFSNDEIHAAIDRERRLEQAHHIDFRRHKHNKTHNKTLQNSLAQAA